MKKEYSKMLAVKIPLATDATIMAGSSCAPVYTTHFDKDNNNLCDAVDLPAGMDWPVVTGTEGLVSQMWSDCEANYEEEWG